MAVAVALALDGAAALALPWAPSRPAAPSAAPTTPPVTAPPTTPAPAAACHECRPGTRHAPAPAPRPLRRPGRPAAARHRSSSSRGPLPQPDAAAGDPDPGAPEPGTRPDAHPRAHSRHHARTEPVPGAARTADPFSLLAWVFTPIFQVLFLGLTFFYNLFGDIGIAIIALTILIRPLLLPLFRRRSCPSGGCRCPARDARRSSPSTRATAPRSRKSR